MCLYYTLNFFSVCIYIQKKGYEFETAINAAHLSLLGILPYTECALKHDMFFNWYSTCISRLYFFFAFGTALNASRVRGESMHLLRMKSR